MSKACFGYYPDDECTQTMCEENCKVVKECKTKKGTESERSEE